MSSSVIRAFAGSENEIHTYSIFSSLFQSPGVGASGFNFAGNFEHAQCLLVLAEASGCFAHIMLHHHERPAVVPVKWRVLPGLPLARRAQRHCLCGSFRASNMSSGVVMGVAPVLIRLLHPALVMLVIGRARLNFFFPAEREVAVCKLPLFSDASVTSTANDKPAITRFRAIKFPFKANLQLWRILCYERTALFDDVLGKVAVRTWANAFESALAVRQWLCHLRLSSLVGYRIGPMGQTAH